MERVGGISTFSPQTLFSVDNFIHYMTVSLEMLMNEVKREKIAIIYESLRFQMQPGCYLCTPGSSYDRQCGPDLTHADSEGGAQAHARLPAPEVITMTPIIMMRAAPDGLKQLIFQPHPGLSAPA